MKKTLLIVALLALALAACSKKPDEQVVAPETPPAATDQASASTTAKDDDDRPTVAEAIDAAIRAHPRSTTVCYDKSIEGFLILYPHKDPVGEQQYFEGWYYLKYPQMWHTSNKIWFMKDQPDDDYVHVYPDVTGLDCKNS